LRGSPSDQRPVMRRSLYPHLLYGLRLVDSFKFIGCALAKFPVHFKLTWRKGDIASTPMSEYNTMDAVILYYGWAKFSTTAYEETEGMDPSSLFLTAAFSSNAFRYSDYDELIMDLSSWHVKRRACAMDNYWFIEILIRELGLKVVKNKVIRGRAVDAYDETTNTVYQFHGCYWHGCHECFPNREDVRLASTKRDNAILDANYKLEITWEHDFRARCSKISRSQRPTRWVYTMPILEGVSRYSCINTNATMMKISEAMTSTWYIHQLCWASLIYMENLMNSHYLWVSLLNA
jgi:hypothetical protein